MLWTRGPLTRNWGVHATGITVSPAVYPGPRPILRGGTVGLHLPPVHRAMDPSDPKTWTGEVRFT